MEEAIGAAHRFGNDFGERNCIPVYFYGEAALSPERKELFHIRRGGYEVLKEKLRDPKWTPDAGRCAFDAHRGATAVGAREPLIAFNINLATNNASIAVRIASEIREANGGFRYVKALGLFLETGTSPKLL